MYVTLISNIDFEAASSSMNPSQFILLKIPLRSHLYSSGACNRLAKLYPGGESRRDGGRANPSDC